MGRYPEKARRIGGAASTSAPENKKSKHLGQTCPAVPNYKQSSANDHRKSKCKSQVDEVHFHAEYVQVQNEAQT